MTIDERLILLLRSAKALEAKIKTMNASLEALHAKAFLHSDELGYPELTTLAETMRQLKCLRDARSSPPLF